MPRNPAGTEIARQLCDELSSRLTAKGGKPVTPRQLERLGSTGYACTPHITRKTVVEDNLKRHLLIALHLYRDHPRMDDRLVNISALILGSSIVSKTAIKADVLSRLDDMIFISQQEKQSEYGFENMIDTQQQRTYRPSHENSPSPQADYRLAFHATRNSGLDTRDKDEDDPRKHFQSTQIAIKSIENDLARYDDSDLISLNPGIQAQFMTAVDGDKHDAADYIEPFPSMKMVRRWIADNGIPNTLLPELHIHYHKNIEGCRLHKMPLTTKVIEMCVMRAVDNAVTNEIRNGPRE